MSSRQPLCVELEAKARELVTRLRSQTEDDLLALARLLVSKEDGELFGQTEFEVRDIVHGMGAKAYRAHLEGKKTVTRAAASSARTVGKVPSSTDIAAKQR